MVVSILPIAPTLHIPSPPTSSPRPTPRRSCSPRRGPALGPPGTPGPTWGPTRPTPRTGPQPCTCIVTCVSLKSLWLCVVLIREITGLSFCRCITIMQKEKCSPAINFFPCICENRMWEEGILNLLWILISYLIIYSGCLGAFLFAFVTGAVVVSVQDIRVFDT